MVSLPFARLAHHEVILVLFVHRRLPLVVHEEVLGIFVGLDRGGRIVEI